MQLKKIANSVGNSTDFNLSKCFHLQHTYLWKKQTQLCWS